MKALSTNFFDISERSVSQWPKHHALVSLRATRWPYGTIFLAVTIITSPRTKAWRNYKNEKILKVKRKSNLCDELLMTYRLYLYSSTEGIFVYCSTRPEVLSARNETCLEAIRRAYGRFFSVWSFDWLRCDQSVCQQLASETLAQGIQKDKGNGCGSLKILARLNV